jgi:hypothetical protein
MQQLLNELSMSVNFVYKMRISCGCENILLVLCPMNSSLLLIALIYYSIHCNVFKGCAQSRFDG